MQTSKTATDNAIPLEPMTERQSSPVEAVVVEAVESHADQGLSPIEAVPFYQANGTIEAELERDELGIFSLRWHDKSWPISFMGGNKLGKIKKLVGQRLYWRVYPIPAWTDGESRVCRFTVVSQPKNLAHVKDGEFKLSGCWQALPQWETHPVRQAYFAVYRNRNGLMTGRNIYYSNYALNWDEPPFVPNDEHKSPWHSVVVSLQDDGVFNFVRLLDGPKPAPYRVRRAELEPLAKSDNLQSVVDHRPRLKSSIEVGDE